MSKPGLRSSMTLADVEAHNARVRAPYAAVNQMLAPALDAAVKSHTKPSKYFNRKVYEDRIQFDSKKEAQHYRELRFMECGGLITGLVVHPVFPLHGANGTRIGRYSADFRFIENGAEVIVDVKSPRTSQTAAFRRTLKLVADEYQIDVKVLV